MYTVYKPYLYRYGGCKLRLYTPIIMHVHRPTYTLIHIIHIHTRARIIHTLYYAHTRIIYEYVCVREPTRWPRYCLLALTIKFITTSSLQELKTAK